MNKINFQQAGGFPLETETLDFMQSACAALQAFAALAGDNYILSGCQPQGAYFRDGFVVINGELLPFRGGLTQSDIVVREDRQPRPFENGQLKDVFFTRYATFGTGDGAIPLNSMKRLKTLDEFRNLPTSAGSEIDIDETDRLATSRAVKLLNDKINALIPQGLIVIWSGRINKIPAGWALCNGENNTPDLTNRFVLGAGWHYSVGNTGGEKEHTLTVDEMPRHTHTQRWTSGPGGAGGSGGHLIDGREDTGTAGANQPHNNMPPYYALAYIMKI